MALPDARLYPYRTRVYDPVLGRFLQTDPIGYEDGLNLYAYVGNDPFNATDPTGMCKDRDTAGECLVINNAGPIGATAAAALQAAVRTYDHAMRALDPSASVSGDVGLGQSETATGAQLQASWSNTQWIVEPEGTTFGNSYGAEMHSSGIFRALSSYLQGYRDSAIAHGKDPDVATLSVVSHDFSHTLNVGAQILQNLPNYSNQAVFNQREILTSRLARTVSQTIGVRFECYTFGLGC